MHTEPYRIHVTPTARRDLHRLPAKVAAACAEFILGPLADNPHRVGKRLGGDLADCCSARRGPYRIVYQLRESDRQVDILSVDHRADIYRPR